MSAISNLVQNAIKFTKVNGTISIRGRSLGERVLIDIEDECGGLAPGKLEEMFLPFSRIGENKTGMGLGLSISQRAVTLNKGLLTVANLPGKGCIFTIDLPRALVV
jgi:signal transduction histidine kinase